MDEAAKMETHHLSSAAAFVEGGIQDACDDACSICLEAFCESDPSTVTSCKHEFHLQCILEWCQRSAQCPMCWQSISLKDPISQELLGAVERERIFRSNQTQNAAVFRHPMLGDFQLQHLPVGADAMELEERIIQHLAAAAAMGRAHHARREGQRGRSAAQGRPQVLVFSRHTDTSSTDSAGANSLPRVETEHAPANVAASPSALPTSMVEEAPPQSPYLTPVRADQVPSGTSVPTANTPVLSNNRVVCSAGQSTPVNQDTAGPSDFLSLSESFKARLHAVSMRYKESITKSTRGWKERLFSRSTSGADLGSEVRREVNAETATVSHMMESLDTRESRCSSPHNMEGRSVTEPINERTPENHIVTLPNENIESASSSTTPGPN